MIKTENNCFKAFGYEFRRYTAFDFQGWSKMTLKIKMAYISIFKSFEKFFGSHL